MKFSLLIKLTISKDFLLFFSKKTRKKKLQKRKADFRIYYFVSANFSFVRGKKDTRAFATEINMQMIRVAQLCSRP